MPAGKVWLVGAGPGDSGLLTCRGREVLQRAEVVVFDRLVGDGVLALMPREAECINVGKEGGRHPVPQREIEEILVAKALEGRRVVRLKGGDPFVFGRGGEEIEALLAHGIPYEVIPGITSAVSAPECAGIPVTHRGRANSLHIITAHTREGGIAREDYEALARMKGTILFLMGVASIPEICRQLASHGVPETTPMAAVERGSTGHQRRLSGTLKDFARRAADFGLSSPSVIIAGSVAELGERFSWKEHMPLFGKKILITRPQNRQGRLSRMLRDLGAETVEFPCIATEPLKNPLPSFAGFSWIGFTSVTGVECFFQALAEEGRDVRSIGTARIAAIGPATARTLRERGLMPELVPDVYDGVHMAQALAQAAGTSPILMFRALDGSPELTETLRNSGAVFQEQALYRTKFVTAPFVPADIDAALFTSASTVRGFKAACPGLEVPLACCIGLQTAEEARKQGFENIRIAKKATLEDLTATLLTADHEQAGS